MTTIPRGQSVSTSYASPSGSMHVLVCPHELITGGSQLNAIDLAAKMRDRGYRITVFAPPGVLRDRIAQLGLDYREAPARRHRFDRAPAAALLSIARELEVDLIHAYEWPPAMDALLAAPRLRTPLVTTVLSMDVPDFLPHTVPMLVGTEALAERQRERGGEIAVMEPPIDTDADAPHDAAASRTGLGIDPADLVIAVVGRLSIEHEKAEGVLAAIEVVEQLAARRPVTLLIAGDGERGEEVRARAAEANRRLGRVVIRAEGNVADPRPIYDAADLVLGMGSSALRAMAHAKPLIVQGSAGFWQLLTPDSAERFFRDGFFGDGPSGDPPLDELIDALDADPERRAALGAFGRSLVVRRYSLDRAADELDGLYVRVLSGDTPARVDVGSYLWSRLRFARFRARLALDRSPRLVRLWERIR